MWLVSSSGRTGSGRWRGSASAAIVGRLSSRSRLGRRTVPRRGRRSPASRGFLVTRRSPKMLRKGSDMTKCWNGLTGQKKPIIGTVKDVRFTSGSPFGEQYWTITIDGQDRCFAMWTNLKSDKWARVGEQVEIKLLNDMECHVGHGSKLILKNCAEILEVIK